MHDPRLAEIAKSLPPARVAKVASSQQNEIPAHAVPAQSVAIRTGFAAVTRPGPLAPAISSARMIAGVPRRFFNRPSAHAATTLMNMAKLRLPSPAPMAKPVQASVANSHGARSSPRPRVAAKKVTHGHVAAINRLSHAGAAYSWVLRPWRGQPSPSGRNRLARRTCDCHPPRTCRTACHAAHVVAAARAMPAAAFPVLLSVSRFISSDYAMDGR